MPAKSDHPQERTSALGLTCNIDRAGQRARGLAGALLLVFGGMALVFGVAGKGAGATKALIVGIVLLASGAFCLFEAMNGWCALRAMGFRTKL